MFHRRGHVVILLSRPAPWAWSWSGSKAGAARRAPKTRPAGGSRRAPPQRRRPPSNKCSRAASATRQAEPVDRTTLWLIAGGVILLAFVLVGLVAVNRRRAVGRRQKLEIPNEPVGGGWAEPAQDAGDSPASFRRRLRPLRCWSSSPARSRSPRAPVLERPEAPESRLARLRRRLAGSNSPLSRGLLMLISRDRIDEDTWEEFEEILITSDLGVAPTTELVSALRTKFRVEGIAEPAKARAILRAELVKLVDPTLDRTLQHRPARVPGRGDGGRGERDRQDHHRGQARPGPGGRGQGRAAGGGRHLPGRGGRPARDLGQPGRRADRTRRRGCRPGQRRVRGGQGRHRAGGRRGADRHRRPAAHQDRPDGRAGQGEAGDRAAGPGRARCCWCWTPPPGRTG